MKDIKIAVRTLIVFTLICGGIYPALVTGLARAVFPGQATGSLITDGSGKVIGSRLIGQPFSDPGYFWPRPSATASFAGNPLASGGSNSGPTNPAYLDTVAGRIAGLREAGFPGDIPAELVQASASGLDPHITDDAALAQVSRVARARHLEGAQVRDAVLANVEGRQLGFMGESRVNVLSLNLFLDRMDPQGGAVNPHP